MASMRIRRGVLVGVDVMSGGMAVNQEVEISDLRGVGAASLQKSVCKRVA